MRISFISILVVLVVGLVGGAEPPAGGVPQERSEERNDPALTEPGERLKKRTADERREYWERQGRASRKEWERRRKELEGLTPEERRAKIRKWREAQTGHGQDIRKLTPEERLQKRKEFEARLKVEIAALEAKKASGQLTAQEARRLNYLGKLRKRFERGRKSGDEEKSPKGEPGKRCGIRPEPCLGDGCPRPVVFQQGPWSRLTRI